MLPILSFLLVLTGSVSAPATAPPPSADQPRVIQNTVRTNSDGTTKVETQSVDAGTTTATLSRPDGTIAQLTANSERHVLIETQARPVLDRKRPGSFSEVANQRRQLARDLEALDRKRGSKKPARIKREFHTLFSGVAAIVEAAAVDDIRKLPNVVAVHEDARVHAQLTESVPLIGALAVAATHGVTGAGVKVAVIDTGIDYTHADLGGCLGAACKVIGGYDFINDDSDPRDDNGHGTHVAGIIAANGTLKGVAPAATLFAYKVLDAGGYGYNSDIIAGIERAVLDGAKVANLSLGGPGGPDDPMSLAIDNATAAGMLSVIAAGNSGSSYQTIGSPGTARTALTVGATDKSWQMASFSSRGYVVAGNQFLLKPEIIAPGVDIRSTVPTTGQHGDPSGYKSLNGTSMAAPHVAGAAALLLHWNNTQTPAQLKDRLVSSASATPADLFSEGAGAIDLVAAFGLRIAASPTSLYFGVVSERSGTIVRDQVLTLRNQDVGPLTLTLSNDATLPAGATLQFIPSNVTIASGATANVTVRLTVDGAITPDAPDPLAWSTTIAVTGGAYATHVPAYFFRGSLLDLTFDEAPWFVDLIGPAGELRTFLNPPASLTTLVKSGSWDVIAGFLPPVAMVIREQQNVQESTTLHITRAQANRAFTVNAVDEAGQPLDWWGFRRSLALLLDPSLPGRAAYGRTISSGNDYTISDVSSRFDVGLIGGGTDDTRTRFYSSSWIAKGVSGGVTLPAPGGFRRIEQRAAAPWGSNASVSTAQGFALAQPWGAFASFTSSTEEQVERALYLQSTGATNSLLPIRKGSMMAFSNFDNHVISFLDGPFLLHDGGPNILADGMPWFTMFGSSWTDGAAVLGPAVQRWDFDAAPSSFPVRLVSAPGYLGGNSRSYSTGWLTHTATDIVRAESIEPAFALYRAGVFVGTYPLYNIRYGISIPSEPGPHELRAYTNYELASGVYGSTHVVAAFDNTKSDANPPYIWKFHIEQNGVRTATPTYSATGPKPHVKFHVWDDNVPYTATLEWRPNGTTEWIPLPVTINMLHDYDAELSMNGTIDLRITATDSSGNTFREDWTPAVAMITPAPPTFPYGITATRSGTTSINISWPPAQSNAGIASYRIERVPGNTIIEVPGTSTSYVDTGLVDGNAYFYRVTAVDTNNLSSTPTTYDVATLIQFADDPVIARVTPIRGTHISQLRRAVDAVRTAAGLGTAWTDYAPATGFVTASDFEALRDLLNEALTSMGMPGINFSFPYAVSPGFTIRVQNLADLRNGVK